MDVKAELKKLDVNGDGKIDVEDAVDVINQKLAERKPLKIFGAGVAVGAIGGFVAGVAVGRASK